MVNANRNSIKGNFHYSVMKFVNVALLGINR